MVTLSGKWSLSAIGNDAGWKQRIVISGSAGNDGPHEMVLGTTIANVQGHPFVIAAQAFDPVHKVWIESLMQSTMSWDNGTGLQVRINADDDPPNGDLDFNDLVVLCTAEDPDLSSPLAGPRPDLSIPETFLRGIWRPGRPRRPNLSSEGNGSGRVTEPVGRRPSKKAKTKKKRRKRVNERN